MASSSRSSQAQLPDCLRGVDVNKIKKLPLPPKSTQAFRAVQAVLATPGHPLFTQTATWLTTGLHKLPLVYQTDPDLCRAILHAIKALPAGLTPRGASVAAALLCDASTRLLLTDTGLLWASSPETLLRQLVVHGVLPLDAAATMTEAEAGAKYLQSVNEANPVTGPWLCTPRFMVLTGLMAMVATVSRLEEERGERGVVLRALAGLGGALLDAELLDWLVQAVVETRVGTVACLLSTALCKLDVETAKQVVEPLRAALRRVPTLAPVLRRLPQLWLDSFFTTHDSKDPLEARRIMAWGEHTTHVYGLLFQPTSKAELVAMPVPDFIPRMAGALLQLWLRGGAPHAAAGGVKLRESVARVREALFAVSETNAASLGCYVLQALIKLVALHSRFFEVSHASNILREVAEQRLLTMLLEGCLHEPADARPHLTLTAACMSESVIYIEAGSGPEQALVRKLHKQLQGELGGQIMTWLDSDVGGRFLDFILGPVVPSYRMSAAMAVSLVLPINATSPVAERMLLELALPSLMQRVEGDYNYLLVEVMHAASFCLGRCHFAAPVVCRKPERAAAVLHTLTRVLQRAGARRTFDGCERAMYVMAQLQVQQCRNKLTRQELVACQKEVLWRIGTHMGRRDQDRDGTRWHKFATEEQLWEYVSFITSHSMTGEQLKSLFRTMEAQSYQSDPGLAALKKIEPKKGCDTPRQAATESHLLAFVPRLLQHIVSSNYACLPSGFDLVASFIRPCLPVAAALALMRGASHDVLFRYSVPGAVLSMALVWEELEGSAVAFEAVVAAMGLREDTRLNQCTVAARDLLASELQLWQLGGLAWLLLLMWGRRTVGDVLEVLCATQEPMWLRVRRLARDAEGPVAQLAAALVWELGGVAASVGGGANRGAMGLGQAAGEAGSSGSAEVAQGQHKYLDPREVDEAWKTLRGMLRTLGDCGKDAKPFSGPGGQAQSKEAGAARALKLPGTWAAWEVLKGCWWECVAAERGAGGGAAAAPNGTAAAGRAAPTAGGSTRAAITAAASNAAASPAATSTGADSQAAASTAATEITPASTPAASMAAIKTTPASTPAASMAAPETTPARTPAASTPTADGATPAAPAASLAAPETTPAAPAASMAAPETAPAAPAASMAAPETAPAAPAASMAAPETAPASTPAADGATSAAPAASLAAPETTPAAPAASMAAPKTAPAAPAASMAAPETAPAAPAASLAAPETAPAAPAASMAAPETAPASTPTADGATTAAPATSQSTAAVLCPGMDASSAAASAPKPSPAASTHAAGRAAPAATLRHASHPEPMGPSTGAKRAEAAAGTSAAGNAAVASGAAAGTSAAAGALSRACAVCRTQHEQMHLCSACCAVRYCGVDCQRAHWKQHKKVCKPAAQAAVAAAGSSAR